MRLLLLALLLVSGCALAVLPVKFGDALDAKFHHPRCLRCHQFNSARHEGRAFNSHSARFLCDRCHTANITGLQRGEWIAPPETLDWTELNARDTCRLIKHNLGGETVSEYVLVGNMRSHLLGDVRVRWALDNGMTPGASLPFPAGSRPSKNRRKTGSRAGCSANEASGKETCLPLAPVLNA